MYKSIKERGPCIKGVELRASTSSPHADQNQNESMSLSPSNAADVSILEGLRLSTSHELGEN
jgi:hypothetical protein